MATLHSLVKIGQMRNFVLKAGTTQVYSRIINKFGIAENVFGMYRQIPVPNLFSALPNLLKM